MRSKSKISRKGFTLIELLVTISIVALLASVVLASLSGARKAAGDAATVQEIYQLRDAMTSYYMDKNDYPGNAFDPSTNYYWISSGDYVNEILVHNRYASDVFPSKNFPSYLWMRICDAAHPCGYGATYSAIMNFFLPACVENGEFPQAEAYFLIDTPSSWRGKTILTDAGESRPILCFYSHI